jgi:hypothetical protein
MREQILDLILRQCITAVDDDICSRHVTTCVTRKEYIGLEEIQLAAGAPDVHITCFQRDLRF